MAQHGFSRRALLAGGLGAAVAGGAAAAGYGLVEAGALPGKYRLAQLIGACGSAPPPPRPAGFRPGARSVSGPPTGTAG